MNGIAKIGLLGLGAMGKNHLRVLSLLKGVQIVFIYDQNQLVTEELARAYKVQGITNLSDYSGELDGVIIATPTTSHEKYISYYASRVKYIFVEKPLTSSHEEALRILSSTSNKNLNIQIGFIERYNPAVLAVKEIIDSTDSVVSIDFTRTNKISSRITDVDVALCKGYL